MSLRDLPSVHDLARELEPDGLPERVRILVAREAIDRGRETLRHGGEADVRADAHATAGRIARRAPQTVVNATGIIIHTNLGRVPLHEVAVRAMARAASGYGNVELDLDTGARGGRADHVRMLLRELTGAEDAHLMGNNAGALFATLNVLAGGRQVPVSRGELIEIGGSYRLPDLMRASGASLVEVGTTNRTRADDYSRAVTAMTALLLKVHPSNFTIVGFAEQPSLAELRAVADAAAVPLVFDAGSGLLDETTPWLRGGTPAWLRDEPGIRQSAAVADLTLFSGDKLLGGPQAGIIVGRGDLVDEVRSHPISRAMRVGGPTLAGLGATLELYADGRGGELPVWSLATADRNGLEARSRSLAQAAGGTVEEGMSMIGGGSTPGRGVPTPIIRLPGGDVAHRRLLEADPPILARRDAGDLIIDLRAVPPELDARLGELLTF